MIALNCGAPMTVAGVKRATSGDWIFTRSGERRPTRGDRLRC